MCVWTYARPDSLHYHLGNTLPWSSCDCDPAFQIQNERKENSSQEDFPVKVPLWVRAINPLLAAFYAETRITSSQNRPVFGFLCRTLLDAGGKNLFLRVCASVGEEKRKPLVVFRKAEPG